MKILAIDPGTNKSGWVHLDESGTVIGSGIDDNEDVRELLRSSRHDYYAIEWIESFGMPVGQAVFETVWWCGVFSEVVVAELHRVTRREVKLHLCNSARANDANVRQALIDKYLGKGGGKTPQIGTKARPGPLYGIKSHMWSALAVGVTFLETNKIKVGLHE